MKKMKKLFAVMLSLAMVLGMSMTAFATEPEEGAGSSKPQQTATITVKELNEGSKVTYKKIVELDPAGRWKWVDGYNDDTFGMTLEQIKKAVEAGGANADAAAGAINPNLSAMNFEGFTTDAATEQTAGADRRVAFEVGGAGLYVIQATDTTNEYKYNNMIAYVGYSEGILQNAEVTAKGESVKIEKDIVNKGDGDNDKTVAAGDEVEYQVTAKYPYFEKDETKSFQIKDTITKGGTLKTGTVTVKIKDGETETDITNNGFLVVENEGLTGFVANLDAGKYNSEYAGKDLVITYTVVIDEDAQGTIENVAESTGSNGSGSKHEVIIPTTSAEITKTNTDGSKPLTGAEFTLYTEVVDGEDVTGVSGIEVVNGKSLKPVAGYVNVAVGEDGKVKFDGLDIQKTYWIKETKAPEGYAIDEEYRKLVFEGEGLVEKGTTEDKTTDENGVVHITTKTEYEIEGAYAQIEGFNDGLNFHDSELSSLPSTGGIGTTIFTIGGCLIMIIAAALFFISRRKSEK